MKSSNSLKKEKKNTSFAAKTTSKNKDLTPKKTKKSHAVMHIEYQKMLSNRPIDPWCGCKYPQAVFITGASSGLGKALAIAYAKPENTLFLCGRNVERLKETVELCMVKKANVHAFIFDVADAKATTLALQEAEAIHPIDLVIANAGISGGVLGIPENADATRAIMKTNIEGVLNTVLPSIELFKKNGGGQIAIISSIAGYRGLPSCPAYSASKACTKAWGTALRGFLKQYNIAVSVVCPGFIQTPLTDKNKFKMPLLMHADKAAHIIKTRLCRNPAIIAFPWPMVFAAWIASVLPSFIIHPILDRLPKKEH